MWCVTMFGHDKVIGECILSVTGLALLYYLLWVVGLPFVDEDSTIRLFFPNPLIALIVPTVIFVFLILLTGVYIVHALYVDYCTNKKES